MSEHLISKPGQSAPEAQKLREKISQAAESGYVCGGKCRICPFPGARCGQLPHEKEA